MENKQIPTPQEETKKEDKNIFEELNGEDAGPSGTVSLPGAVTNKPKLGSKSEHSIRQIITTKDVALALNSLNFGTNNQAPKTLNELKLPILERDLIINKEGDSTTILDLKKFMASCFKLNKENTPLLSEVPLQSIRIVNNPENDTIQEVSEVTTGNIQTTCLAVQNMPNEVIITNKVEPKISKSEKKKTSGNASERADILAVAQRDSLSSIGSNVCRICMTRGRERLISPCNCKGSLANVHLSCLERWLNQVGRNHCELCGYSYPAIRTPRYTVLQALRLWFGNPRNRSHLQSDCLIFWLLSTVTAGLLAVCIVGTQYFVIEGNKFGKMEPGIRKEEGISHRITETAMDFFMAIVLCGYSVTVYLLWKDHYVMWNRWRRANVNVRLLLAPDANPVPFSPRNRYNVV